MNQEVQTLTALRGIAALWVVIYHYNNHVGTLPGAHIVRQGFLAVDIFFTLSGFILAYVYGARFDIWNFLRKRVARLYPVHLVTLIAFIILAVAANGMGLSNDVEISNYEVFLHVFMLHALGLNDELVLNYPSWSISAEFFAYLAFPLLAPMLLNSKLGLSALATCAFFAICVSFSAISGSIFWERTFDFSILRILPEFAAGIVAARFCIEGRASFVATTMVAGFLFGTGLYFSLPLLVILGTPFLLCSLYLSKLSVPAPFRYLGLISYSLYMVHAIVEKVAFTLLEIGFSDEQLPNWVVLPVLALALGTASLMYHLVEEPGRNLLVRKRKNRAK